MSRLVLIASVALLLSACGLKGNLYLPETSTPVVITPASSSSSSSSSATSSQAAP